MSFRVRLDPIACDGRGVCAELLPERIELDDWGYPMIDASKLLATVATGANEVWGMLCACAAYTLSSPQWR